MGQEKKSRRAYKRPRSKEQRSRKNRRGSVMQWQLARVSKKEQQ